MAQTPLTTRNQCTIDPDDMDIVREALDREIQFSNSLLKHFDGKLKKCLNTCTSEEEIADTRFEVDYMKEYVTEHIKEIENIKSDTKRCDSAEYAVLYKKLYES